MAKLLRGICIGMGYFSRFHLEAWGRIPEVQITAVCDLDGEKAGRAAKEHRIASAYAAGDFSDMLEREKPDFVDLITGPATHLDLCSQAVKYPVAIICQKPLAPTFEQTLELARLIENSGRRFMVHENWRWQPWYREIHRILHAGELGTFFHLAATVRLGDGWGERAYLDRQPFFREYPRLLIHETGVHYLDTYRYLFGEIETIQAHLATNNPGIRGEDRALLFCRFCKGGTAVWDASRYNETEAADPRYTFGRLRIDGSAGHLELNEQGVLTVKKLGQSSVTVDYRPSRQGFAGDCVHAIQRHFTDCMLSSEAFESGLDDYLKTVRLVEAAYESSASGQAVQV